MIIQKTKIAAVLSCAAVTPIWAQTAQLPVVTVVANPIIEEVRTDDYSAVSAVVGEEQLRDLNALDLASALRRTPGVSISRYNPVGAFGGDQGGAVMIRGMGVSRPGSEIKTYVDGVPFYMPVWNHPLLDMLPINGMGSVTVYKSPQPHITGNNFASINLETKRPKLDGVLGNLRASYGRFSTVNEQADIVGKSETLEYSFAQGYAKSDGHRTNADGTLNNAMGRVATSLNSNWKAGLSFLATDTKAGDPGDNPAQYDIRADSISTFVQHHHENASGEFRLYKNSGKAKWLAYTAAWGAGNNSQYDFDMYGLRWREQARILERTTVSLGIDYDAMSGTSANLNNSASTEMPTFRVTSPFASIVHNIMLSKEWALTPSVVIRHYQHNTYESGTSPAIGVSLANERVNYYFNASRGLNYPGLDGPALDADAGRDASWRNLKAEKINHREIGVRLSPSSNTEINVSIFKDKVSDRYFNTGMGGSFFSTGSFDNRGAEISLRQALSQNWSLFVGATYLDPNLYNLPYAPKQAYSLGLNGKTGSLKVALDIQSQSDFYSLNWDRSNGGSSASNSVKLGGFSVVNTRVAYPTTSLGKRGEVFVAVENLLDKDYAYRSGYPMPGRWAQIGLVASFN